MKHYKYYCSKYWTLGPWKYFISMKIKKQQSGIWQNRAWFVNRNIAFCIFYPPLNERSLCYIELIIGSLQGLSYSGSDKEILFYHLFCNSWKWPSQWFYKKCPHPFYSQSWDQTVSVLKYALKNKGKKVENSF